MEAFPVLDVSKNAVYQREVNVVRALAKHYQGTVPVIPTIFTPAHCIPEFCGGIEQARYYMDNHPEAVDAMLRALVQTELQLVDAYIEAGADGFFFAQRYSNADILSEQEFERFCRPYDEMLLARAHGRTWFNMVHVHGAKNFFWDQFKTYDVQALSWENTPQQIPEEERSTVAKVRAVTDKILITGTDQFHDFYGNRQEVLDRFRRRVERAQDLLRATNLTVTEVCFAVGYASLGSFSARFKELVGENPSEFQRRYAVAGAPRIPGCFVFMWGLAEHRKGGEACPGGGSVGSQP